MRSFGGNSRERIRSLGGKSRGLSASLDVDGRGLMDVEGLLLSILFAGTSLGLGFEFELPGFDDNELGTF